MNKNEREVWGLRLKRLELCRDYFNQTKPEKVDLSSYVRSAFAVNTTQHNRLVEKHIHTIGQGWQSCGSVACLAGVLLTMPEVQELFVPEKSKWGLFYLTELSARIDSLNSWLVVEYLDGMSEIISAMFSGVQSGEYGSHFEIAQRRLENVITYVRKQLQSV